MHVSVHRHCEVGEEKRDLRIIHISNYNMGSLRIPDIHALAFRQYDPMTSNLLFSISKALNLNRDVTTVKMVEEGPLKIPSYIKATKTPTKIIRINFSKQQKLTKHLQQSERVYSRKIVELSKDSELCGTLNRPILSCVLSPLPPPHTHLPPSKPYLFTENSL